MKNEVVFCVPSNQHNFRKARCFNPDCGCIVPAGMGYRVGIAGVGVRVVCAEHYGAFGLLSYHGNANRRRHNDTPAIGTTKKTALASQTIGIEIETYANDTQTADYTALRYTLETHFFVKAESDCTVSAEYPTERMQGLASISKILQRMDKQNLLRYVDNAHCGAHVHTYCNDVEYVRRYYHSLFLPLQNYFDSLGHDKRVEYFGRDFGEWCNRIYDGCNAENHANFINTQHSTTLEFRLPRIAGYAQYMGVIKFWREAGLLINQWDFEKLADRDTRKRKAQACAVELVKLAGKYFPA